MRLLRTDKVQFVELKKPQNYAILSHRWSQKEEEEISFDEMEKMQGNIGLPTSASLTELFHALPTYHGWKSGYKKIQMCCQTAFREGFFHIWIDTCCIDKKSSSELSEAINSMFQWYSDSDMCIAYLEDVPGELSKEELSAAFRNSKWFTRGWTLQELLAPRRLTFYSADWKSIGDREEWRDIIAEITNIHRGALCGNITTIRSYSIAQKMSWAWNRETSRDEDLAYSLMGIFAVNIPLLYGEGKKAFLRLQEEIIKNSDDQSIFFWDFSKAIPAVEGGLLAPSPRCFQKSSDCVPYQFFAAAEPYSMTNAGLRIRGAIQKKSSSDYRFLLNCYEESRPHRVIKLALRKLNTFADQFVRHENALRFDTDLGMEPRLHTIYIRQEPAALEMPNRDGRNLSFHISADDLSSYGYAIDHVYPPEQLDLESKFRVQPPKFDTHWSVTNWTWHVLVGLKHTIPSRSATAFIGYIGRGDIFWCHLNLWDGEAYDMENRWHKAVLELRKEVMSSSSRLQMEVEEAKHTLGMRMSAGTGTRIDVNLAWDGPATPPFANVPSPLANTNSVPKPIPIAKNPKSPDLSPIGVFDRMPSSTSNNRPSLIFDNFDEDDELDSWQVSMHKPFPGRIRPSSLRQSDYMPRRKKMGVEGDCEESEDNPWGSVMGAVKERRSLTKENALTKKMAVVEDDSDVFEIQDERKSANGPNSNELNSKDAEKKENYVYRALDAFVEAVAAARIEETTKGKPIEEREANAAPTYGVENEGSEETKQAAGTAETEAKAGPDEMVIVEMIDPTMLNDNDKQEPTDEESADEEFVIGNLEMYREKAQAAKALASLMTLAADARKESNPELPGDAENLRAIIEAT